MAIDYNRLKRTLEFDKSGKWLAKDSDDDFFPDALNFADIAAALPDYLKRYQHRILQIDTFPHLVDFVPKANGMIREAVWLHPIHRLSYLACLHYLLPKLDKNIPSEVYSYRLDAQEKDEYPFAGRIDRWKLFHNDFRQSCLDDQVRAVLVTDIASFYDHIRVDELATRIRAMLGPGMSDEDKAVVDFLEVLVTQWSNDGYAIPQNLDPSSFFGSLFLSGVDREIIDKRYRYFRWVDDIRICAANKKQAIRALHDLQNALSRYRMFLASDKTRIIEKGTPEFEELIDVSDDLAISEIENKIARGDRSEIAGCVESAFSRLEVHAGPKGDDRKFRAFANRLLQISDFEPFSQPVLERLVPFVVSRMETHPNRSDYWTKMLQAAPDGVWLECAERLLLKDPSVYNWQRFYIWRLLTARSSIPSEFKVKALSTLSAVVSDLEASQAVVCYGRHAESSERESLYAQYFGVQRSYPVQRAILIAIQELHPQMRDKMYARAIERCPDHEQLVTYLKGLDVPKYGIVHRTRRTLPEVARQVEIGLRRGIGKAHGDVVRFRLSRDDFDYE